VLVWCITGIEPGYYTIERVAVLITTYGSLRATPKNPKANVIAVGSQTGCVPALYPHHGFVHEDEQREISILPCTIPLTNRAPFGCREYFDIQ